MRRWVLLGIIAGCVIVVLLSMGDIWHRHKQAEGPAPSAGPSQTATAAPGAQAKDAGPKGAKPAEPERVIEFFKLKMPYMSDNRVIAELMLPHGKNLLNAQKLQAENGTLTIFRDEKDAAGKPKTVVVNFEKAEVNNEDKSAILQDKVVVTLEEGITLTTTKVFWNPAKNLVSTESPVTITGKDIEVTGVAMEANAKDEKATLKKDVKVTLKTDSTPMMGMSPGPEKKKAPAPAKKTPPTLRLVVITCDGEMHGSRKPMAATFLKNVRLQSAPSFLNCDTLEIRFAEKKTPAEDAEAGKPPSKESSALAAAKGPAAIESATASGHVVYKDDAQEATGDEMIWDAARHIATLKGKNARFKQKDNSITAETMCYNQAEGSLSVPSGGELIFQAKGDLVLTKPEAPQPKKTESAPVPLRVTWAKDMVYNRTKGEAVFNERVKAQQGENWLTADRLEVGFDEQNHVKSLVATGTVALNRETQQAFGNRLEWSAENGVAWLSGEPAAEVRDGESFVGCPKIGFHREQNRIECIGSGYLMAVPKPGKERKGQPKKKADTVGILPGMKGEQQKGPGKIRVTWAERMIFDRNEHKATFYRTVRASRDEMKISSDELQVMFDDANQKVVKVVATDPKGNLHLDHPQGTGTGSRVEWDSADETASLFGEPRAVVVMKERGRRLEAQKIFVDLRTQDIHTEGAGSLYSPSDKSKGKPKGEGTATTLNDDLTVAWTNTLDFERQTNQAIFKGDVRAKSGDKGLDSDALTVQFEEQEKQGTSGGAKPEKKSSLKRAEAEGHVTLHQGNQQEGTGDKFTWDMKSDTASLEGQPARAKGAMEKRSYQIEGQVIKILKLSQKKQDFRVDGKGTLTFPLPKLDLSDRNGNLAKAIEQRQTEDVTITWQDHMFFDQSVGKGACYGGTEVIKSQYRVRSSRLEMDLDEQNQLKELRAIGDVHLFEEAGEPGQGAKEKRYRMEATGEKLTWQKTDDKATLVGDPNATIWVAQGGKGGPPKEEKPVKEGPAPKPGKPGAPPQMNVKCEGHVSVAVEKDDDGATKTRTQADRIVFTGLLSPSGSTK